jgi:hypothetical protein
MMPAIKSRLAALAASLIIATLASWGIGSSNNELRNLIEVWVSHSFDVMLVLGYAVLHPWLQKRTNPTGAITTEAARKLESLSAIKP